MTGETGAVNDFDLLILDCDGVLIDSEGLSADVLIELAAEHGIALTAEHVRQHFLGRSFPTVAANIRASFGIALSPTFEADYRARLLARFETDLVLTPGLLAMLDRLAIPACVATSSSPERARRSLAIAGLSDRFPRPFTASEVAHGKPAPDLFLHAARTLEADPARCVVIEDSLPGLAAAKAAGMTAVHYVGASHMRTAPAGDDGAAVLRHWDDLGTLLPGVVREVETT